MDFVRQIIEPDRLAGIIDIPETLRHRRVELIILPADESSDVDAKESQRPLKRFRKLYKNPIRVKKINKFSRDKL